MAHRFRAFTRKMDTWQIVRGDNTHVVSDHYLDVLAVKLGYDALGAEANESKFTVRQGRTDFLRVEIGDRARAPLLEQRKPWSARPPSADASLIHVDKVFSVLARRLPDPTDFLGFADHVMFRMMSKMKLHFRLLSIPTALGGLGLRPWRGQWHVSVWSTRLPIPVAVLNQTGFRAEQQRQKYSGLGIPISQGEASSLADREVREKMATDDMIGAGQDHSSCASRRTRQSQDCAITVLGAATQCAAWLFLRPRTPPGSFDCGTRQLPEIRTVSAPVSQ
ncbi:hypothetical protein MTO96_044722 [Rhipicephalus appendiculatus]